MQKKTEKRDKKMGVNPRYFLREISQNFRRNLMLNLTSIATVMVLIFQLGFFILVVANINNFSSIALSKLQLTVVLEPNLSMEKITELKGRMLKHPEAEMVRFISKKEAFERLRERMGSKINLENLTRNPLPDTFEVELINPQKIKEMAEEFKKHPGVEDVRYGNQELVQKMINLSYRIYFVGMVVISMLMVSAIFLISNTIRLTVYSRRKEIAIMELVGAHHWFIRGPFIFEGMIHGILGSGIAIIMLSYVYSAGSRWLIEGIPFIPVIMPEQMLVNMSLALLGAGILLGIGSSFFSVNKYLKI
jgi:cell division transport system permease protein